ncbi:transcription factor GTE8 isoform X2 [Cajanus cajan]|uniref:transcription factor GTE8 isoform X2 n=1 Tax=Cajanus cajan TaxID=3821 RepID=UPI00098DA0D7|nr:transcription factor GTE8 isoform X2 [Cajanus cajan]
MMAKSRLCGGYYGNAVERGGETEGSGSSGRMDTQVSVSEDSGIPARKCISLNSSGNDAFGVPMQVVPLSNLSSFQRKGLVDRFSSELEQIRVFRKRIEQRRTNGVTLSSSSDILSCSNGNDGPRMGRKQSISSSVPGSELKPLGQSQKPRGWNRGSSGKFVSASWTSTPSAANALLMKDCESLLKRLMGHQYGWVFNTPVDVVKLNLPDYFSIIKHPMDLGTIKGKLAAGAYSGGLEFADDVRLTFSNAMTYNPRGTDVHFMADTLSKYFELRWKTIEKKLPRRDAVPLPSKLDTCEDAKTTRPMPTSKKRKMTSLPPQPVIMPPAKRVMSDQEKHNLGRELESLLGEMPMHIIDFLKANCSNGGECGEDEIEIDIDDLRDDTLITLRKLLDEFLQEKQKNKTKLEVREIEVLNDSGPSNSSLLPVKGNEPDDDEEVDIVGDEPPFSSYPPVEIEKDTACRINCSSPGSSDTDASDSSDSESDDVKSNPAKEPENMGYGAQPVENSRATDASGRNQSVSGLDKLEDKSQQKPSFSSSDCHQDGECGPMERKVSPDKLYRAALLKNRFADTILKAREKTLSQGDPEKLRQHKEKLEMERQKEKARLQAEAKAAEDARKRAEAEAAAEARRKRELEREAARQLLLQMEKTVEINENSGFLEDLELLRAVPAEHLPSSVGETSPDNSQDGMGSFKFGGGNPLEQLGLYIKVDDDEEEGDAPCVPNPVNDIEEGEID